MGYYSDLDADLVSKHGLERGSPEYYAAAERAEVVSCQRALHRQSCSGCPRRVDPSCVKNIRGTDEVRSI